MQKEEDRRREEEERKLRRRGRWNWRRSKSVKDRKRKRKSVSARRNPKATVAEVVLAREPEDSGSQTQEDNILKGRVSQHRQSLNPRRRSSY